MPVEIQRRRFTADDYQRMGEAGILRAEDRVELIDGEIVSMTPIGPRHMASVDRANRTFVLKAADSAIVRIQGSVRLNLYSEPEPDIVLLRPRQDYYATRMAGPADILLVLEVAESSIDYDRDVKLKLYARSGVHEYWILDLTEDVLTCFDGPDGDTYRHVRHYQHGQSVAPLLLSDCTVAVDDLLGPARI
jgi:Uma2 family endonuclease